MSTITTVLESARVAQAPVRVSRSTSPATNLVAFSSPLVTEGQRAFIDAELADLGAARLRGTHATETVARKAIRVALREAGYSPAEAREMATEIVADGRGA